MKSSLAYLKNHLVCFGSAAFFLVFVCAAHADLQLDVQISNTDTVTITATGSNATGNVSPTVGDNLGDGIDLLTFFTHDVGPVPLGTAPNSTLTTSGGASAYDSAYGDGYELTDQALNLNLFASNGGSDAQTFSTGTAAFTGTFTIDFSGISADLPRVGASGSILSGANGLGSDTPIGTWQVVAATAPEPSTWMLVLSGLSLLVLYRAWMRSGRPANA